MASDLIDKLTRGLHQAFGQWMDRLFPKRRLVLSPPPRGILAGEPVTVIDIGGAMGADERWNTLRDQCRFMFFEPDIRSQDGLADEDNRDVVVPAGLGGADGERMLYLTEGPFASSLYKPNEAILKPFSVWRWYRPAGEVTVSVRTLDGVLAERDGWTPDFIKVDVEGADLEVLHAGATALAHCFGVQIEVSFLDRNVGSPMYGVVDQWLRERDFVPHLLLREHWVRANGLFGTNSSAQLSWADAVYFRPERWVVQRLRNEPDHAERNICAFIAILLVYGRHDFALDLVRSAARVNCVGKELAISLEKSIRNSVAGFWRQALRGLAALVLVAPIAGVAWFAGGRYRAAGRELLRRQAVPLLDILSNGVRRAGLEDSCIADH